MKESKDKKIKTYWSKELGKKVTIPKENTSNYTHYPSLKKLVNVNYTDPRNESEEDKYKIHAEIDGPIIKDGKGISGTYVMYEDEAYPGNYIAVHVSKKMNEDGKSNVTVVAMDKSKALVRDRLSYRRRRSQSISEQMLIDGGK